MLILASLSPRRRELLQIITTDFTTLAPEVDESMSSRLDPRDAVTELALRKAAHIAEQYPDATVIGADTIVALGGRILGKPRDATHAADMLRDLSGQLHHVYTGVALVNNKHQDVFWESTAVRFRSLSEREILEYIKTGEPMDKAGAYGIQGKGALLVEGITGDFFNVMGLPLCALAQKLHSFTEK